MTRYAFDRSAPERVRADPQVIGEALDTIRLQTGGQLHPQDVVAGARDPKSALHPHFEWNDAKAAEGYRMDQARALIRSVRMIDDGEIARPAFLSIRADDGIGYRAFQEVMSNVDLRERLLVQAERDLDAWTRRYRELRDIVELVEPARTELRRRASKPRGAVEARP